MRNVKILRIDMTTGLCATSFLSGTDLYLGGRRLTSKIVATEVAPTCHPLGKHNKLIIACGALAGTHISCANRISVGAKSPLTGGIKEANGGGMVGYHMGRLDVRGIIVEGLPAVPDTKWILHLDKDGARLLPGDDIAGLGVFRKAESLYQRFGDGVALTLIGPVGEWKLPSAGVANTDKDGNPTRYAARGGLGAVMGSKGLLAIVYDSTGAPKETFVDKEEISRQRRDLAKRISENPQTAEVWRYCGTPAMMSTTNKIGALPTHNFRTGRFKGFDEINALAMYDKIVLRGGVGTTTHACMVGCLLQCSNIYPSPDGKEVLCTPMEYENMGLLGSNLCINDLDAIARLNTWCNDLGVDAIEMGAALGVVMEAGVLQFGDAAGAEQAMREVAKGSAFGRVLASGAGVTGIVYGCTRVPTVKNQAMPAYDPRGLKGTGVTYATSPQGADHTAGSTARAKVIHNKKEGQVEASFNAQVGGAMFADMLGVCMKLGAAIPDWSTMLAMVKGRFGVKLELHDFKAMARETVLQERAFNHQAGLGPGHDILPEFFYEEDNPAAGTAFDISPDEMQKMFNGL